MTKKELSFGAIVFRVEKDEIYYLLLKHSENYFNFPKGHREGEEGAYKTTIREVFEETGIDDLEIIKGFKEKNSYFFKKKNKLIFKTVIFFLGETKKKDIKISSEHMGYYWLKKKEAISLLKLNNLKRALNKADSFIKNK